MSWIQITASFAEPPADLSPLVEAYRDFGIENTLESSSSLVGCLASVPGAQETAEALKTSLLTLGADRVEIESLPETDWENSWRQFFKPIRIGKRFLIVPTWEKAEQEPDDIVLTLDPGLAFGTGDHPTTRMCLLLMESLDLSGARVADLGSGSGILSIAAAKLGAQVTAYEIDPTAVEVSRENFTLNQVEVPVVSADGFETGVHEGAQPPQDETPLSSGADPTQSSGGPSDQYDVVLSNIISHTLIRLCPAVRRSLLPGGAWVAAGIIEQNWPEVEKAATIAGFRTQEVLTESGWVGARFQR